MASRVLHPQKYLQGLLVRYTASMMRRRPFNLIEGSLYRSPLGLLEDVPPPARTPKPPGSPKPAATAPRPPKLPRPPKPKALGALPGPGQATAPHPIDGTHAGKLLKQRRCFSRRETHQAVQSIHRSLGSIKRNAHISGEHERKVRALSQAAMSAQHPEERIDHITHALHLMKPFYQKGPGTRAVGDPRLTPAGKDPRLGHLFKGLPQQPQQAQQTAPAG